MNIAWQPYLSVPPEAPDEAIEQVEQVLGVRFPADYRAVIKQHQGQSPEPCGVRVGRSTDVFNCLLHFSPGEAHAGYYILADYESLRDVFPPGVYPFADTPGGNALCFDYRLAPDAPTVVHWDHEEGDDTAIRFVAPSFTALLDSLR